MAGAGWTAGCGLKARPTWHTNSSQNFVLGDVLKLGVVLFQLGGPDSLESIEPFLYNLFSDPDISACR